jgi:hypothetical protein
VELATEACSATMSNGPKTDPTPTRRHACHNIDKIKTLEYENNMVIFSIVWKIEKILGYMTDIAKDK